MSDEFPEPEWNCPKCGGRIEIPFAEYDRHTDRMRCLRRECGHTWEPRSVVIPLVSAIDITAQSIDRTRGNK